MIVKLVLFILLIYVLLSVSLPKLFEKAGIDPKKAYIPGVNMGYLAELVGRKKSHAWWLLFPIVNIFILAGLCIDLVRSFGRYRFVDSLLAVVAAPFYNFYLGSNDSVKYVEPAFAKERDYKKRLAEARKSGSKLEVDKLTRNNPYKKSGLREWSEAIIFAVFAATFIRMFLLEAFMIPTSSMEGSLLTGDFLFVSKMHYGIRTPQTIAMLPLVHNRAPVVGGESYLEKPKLNYYRFPALTSIKRNDPVVFNYPEGDSVYITPERTWSKYDVDRGNIKANIAQYIRQGNIRLVTRPMDKADHYIKRCVAIPGDKLEIRDRQLYINDEKAKDPENLQFSYKVIFQGPINTKKILELDVNPMDLRNTRGNILNLNLDAEQLEKIRAFGNVTIEPNVHRPDPRILFPHDPAHYNWSMDNYGPIVIPKKGEAVELNESNIALYKRIISVYEEKDLDVKGNDIMIDGQKADSYTFEQDYFWMMGDNRHNSEDSRFWGFVPEKNVVGKPMFIWMSLKNGSLKDGIRWNRVFSSANKK